MPNLALHFDRVDRSFTCVLRGGDRDGEEMEVPAEWLPNLHVPTKPPKFTRMSLDYWREPGPTSQVYVDRGEYDEKGRKILECQTPWIRLDSNPHLD